jgi:hypothetical protein
LGGRDCPFRTEPEGSRRSSIRDAGGKLKSDQARTGLDGIDLVITSYGYLSRVPWLTATPWQLVILDEA